MQKSGGHVLWGFVALPVVAVLYSYCNGVKATGFFFFLLNRILSRLLLCGRCLLIVSGLVMHHDSGGFYEQSAKTNGNGQNV